LASFAVASRLRGALGPANGRRLDLFATGGAGGYGVRNEVETSGEVYSELVVNDVYQPCLDVREGPPQFDKRSVNEGLILALA